MPKCKKCEDRRRVRARRRARDEGDGEGGEGGDGGDGGEGDGASESESDGDWARPRRPTNCCGIRGIVEGLVIGMLAYLLFFDYLKSILELNGYRLKNSLFIDDLH